MDLLFIGIVALVASGLTLFSGFGLGTVLLPAFALFFPVTLAIAATAVVHFANNLFKCLLLARAADRRVVLRFGLPAAAAALAGAALLLTLDRLPVWFAYEALGRTRNVTPVNAVVGTLLVLFALLELAPWFDRLRFAARWLPVGGLLSGLLGGLTGMQGALRSAFLLRAGLDKERYVATGVVIAVLVDVSRLAIYGTATLADSLRGAATIGPAVATAIGCAFAGAVIGKRLLAKVTLRTVRLIVATLMVAIGLALVAGWL